jgi:hypothetical protein
MSQCRAGLSLLEFFGCMIALVGGAWLGALYLGIDVRHLAYVALDESKLMQHVPEQWRPAVQANEHAPTSAELSAAVEKELHSLHAEIASLRTERETPAATTNQTAPAETSANTETSEQSTTKELTLAYWIRLCDVIRDERALQLDAEQAATEGNATKVAALKGRVCHFAAGGLKAIPTTGVEPTLVEFGKQLAAWYERGGELYDQAVKIWETPGHGQNGPQLSQEWEQSQQQHQNESRLLNERASTVRHSLTRQFGEEFPEFVGL